MKKNIIFKVKKSGYDEKGALKAAKQGAKAKLKSEFKFDKAEAKSNMMPRKMIKDMIGVAREKYKAGKKEVRKYTDY